MDLASAVLPLIKWPNFTFVLAKDFLWESSNPLKLSSPKVSPGLYSSHPHPPEEKLRHITRHFLVPSCTGSQGLLVRRENWSSEHSFLGSVWSVDKQQRWILTCLPSSKAIAYPKDDKYFNQFSACLAEVSLLLRDFPSSVPHTCPVHATFPI